MSQYLTISVNSQWGNLITLAAVFRDPTLRGCVEEQLLRDLFARTISFFRVIAQPTSALTVDLRILEGLERELWSRSNYHEIMDHPTGSSFTSTASGGGGGPPPPPPPVQVPGPSMPPVARPTGMHSPVNHVSNGMMSMSPPLPSPLPAGMHGASPNSAPHGVSEPIQRQHYPGMLPPLQHQSPR